ncbi:tRNA adenosine deaminase [Corynebacterium poyangense]|uniref:tRNA adenosine deaminase n=1 Tax=Corynebacterium poyangense TaxID=2684405 RepID=A0A7H0SLF9_9CORY|nr:tRNA adenosine deaminase-associated protein [Corynebacterium poyangense]QNQ89384.1 tRNA adenosine deaminase [Corynebacterium poyangense]
MSAASARGSSAQQAKKSRQVPGKASFALVAAYNQGEWEVRRFRDDFRRLSTAEQAVRKLRSEGPTLAMLCVEDDYYVLLRPVPGGLKILLSDLTMAVEDDYAAEIADELGVDIPDIDPADLETADPWPEGDFDLLADLGVSEEILGVIVDDDDVWPSESLARIAQELGCGEEFTEVTGIEPLMDDEEW